MIEDIIQLDLSITLAINGSHSLLMDHLMMIITSTVAWIPLGVFILWYIFHKKGAYTLMLVVLGIGLCILLADGISSGIFKPLVGRYRPSRDVDLMYLIKVVDGYRGGRFGFFSSHAANSLSVAVFLGMLFRSKQLWVMFIIFSLLNCWSRVYLGVHYFGDIMAGLLCGAIVGWCVFWLYRKFGGTYMNDDGHPVIVAEMSTFVVLLLVAFLI